MPRRTVLAENPRSVEFLGSMAWMRALPIEHRERVAMDAYSTTHAAKEVVARKGDPAASWLGVANGLLKISAVSRNGKVLMLTGVPAGSWVGEGSVLKREMRRYDVTAMRRSVVVHIPRATFRWLLDVSLEFNHFIIEHLNERLSQYVGMVETDRLTNPNARLARAILSLFNPIIAPQLGPFLPISQAEFGELTGLSRQRINLCVRYLEEHGYLVAEYGGLVVRDMAGLRAFGENAE